MALKAVIYGIINTFIFMAHQLLKLSLSSKKHFLLDNCYYSPYTIKS